MQPTKYEMFRNNDGFYYQTHCHCGTTMSTGEYLASMSIAYLTCLESMDQHQARCTKASTRNMDALISDERASIAKARDALANGDVHGAIIAMGIPAHAIEVKS